MSSASSYEYTKDLFIASFRLCFHRTLTIPGDIPSILKLAFFNHFDEEMPSSVAFEIPNRASVDVVQISFAERQMMEAILSMIPPLKPSAQALLDCARSILTDGPPLSMNIPLAPGQELPVALHTLNQGTLWACLMGAGANPDLEDMVLRRCQSQGPGEIEMHSKIRRIFTPDDKCLWFLCRKFHFSLNVAEKDGESFQCNAYDRCYHHRMYMGRLFMLDTEHHAALTRARMPRALKVFSDDSTQIAKTPKGLWAWGKCHRNDKSRFSAPFRLTFPECPRVSHLEASLPPWEKHRMVVDVSLWAIEAFILTPVGTIESRGPGNVFKEVALPTGFVPDHILHGFKTTILSMGDRQMISGWNGCGRLGLGHKKKLSGFIDLPHPVEQIIFCDYNNFSIFESDNRLLFAGRVPEYLESFVDLYEGEKCVTPTHIELPYLRTKGFFAGEAWVIWVTEGKSYVSCNFGGLDKFYVPFEARYASIDGDLVEKPADGCKFCNSAGQWLEVVRVASFVAEMRECESPRGVEVDTIDNVKT
ncbi:hypothetical protein J8273_6728 [Carpediemonas membranifera]|uniref:Uncharacterized protein n=1 Tax=Carpediemonas membranifera TaxID=201153 RepID=A0A8J6AZ67_9EUKA|nr:hypothetical protein J8273_6728 [Carpediemonas membranifera]|eukprot:KAG9391998.1 hypothetical protein J8273_6728 [Carpediemonas membranifera]